MSQRPAIPWQEKGSAAIASLMAKDQVIFSSRHGVRQAIAIADLTVVRLTGVRLTGVRLTGVHLTVAHFTVADELKLHSLPPFQRFFRVTGSPADRRASHARALVSTLTIGQVSRAKATMERQSCRACPRR